MNLLVLLLGLVLLAVVSLDFLFTTVGAEERSILSLRMTRAVFRALRRTARGRDSGWRHRMSGPIVMVTLAALWVLGVALAWTLIFAAWPASVVAAPGQPAPGEWDIFAHVGHLLSTLGVGLTEPAGTAWYVVGSMVAVHGMLILTLSVSFTLSTTQTVSRGRAFVEFAEVVDPADPEAFEVLAPWLSEVCSALKSSPFALFYSSPDPRRRLSGALVRFAERDVAWRTVRPVPAPARDAARLARQRRPDKGRVPGSDALLVGELFAVPVRVPDGCRGRRRITCWRTAPQCEDCRSLGPGLVSVQPRSRSGSETAFHHGWRSAKPISSRMRALE